MPKIWSALFSSLFVVPSTPFTIQNNNLDSNPFSSNTMSIEAGDCLDFQVRRSVARSIGAKKNRCMLVTTTNHLLKEIIAFLPCPETLHCFHFAQYPTDP